MGDRIVIRFSPFVLGRDSSSCDAKLDSLRRPKMMSKRHAMIRLRNGAAERGEGVDFEIVDLMSTNACYVDGQKVQGSAHPLHDGSTLIFGKPGKKSDLCFRVVLPDKDREDRVLHHSAAEASNIGKKRVRFS